MRPTFLTVLCILTFVFSGYSVFNSIISYQSAGIATNVAKDAIDNARDQLDQEDDSAARLAEKYLGSVENALDEEKVKQNAIATGIASVLTLIGAVLMWGLDKKGFWLYVIGTAAGILTPVFVYGGLIGAAAGGFSAFFGVLFCILYGVNLKHMK